MNDDLPEIFEQIPPQPAPPSLRERTLASVERELKRPRKPRWERVLERSVAALLVIGVGLNAGNYYFSNDVLPSPADESRSMFRSRELGDLQIAEAVSKRMALFRQPNRRSGDLHVDIEKLIAELEARPAG